MASVSIFLHSVHWVLTGVSPSMCMPGWLVLGTLLGLMALGCVDGKLVPVHPGSFVTGETEGGSHRLYNVTIRRAAGVEPSPALSYEWD